MRLNARACAIERRLKRENGGAVRVELDDFHFALFLLSRLSCVRRVRIVECCHLQLFVVKKAAYIPRKLRSLALDVAQSP